MIKWTNKSVVSFAGQSDPVAKILEKARKVVLEAMETGWTGPPYNPLEIATLLGARVRPTFDIADARTTVSNGSPVIEFNPSRPRERVRFSIAHEIAHLLFPDVHDEPRHRGGTGRRGDEWQLEMLCNMAAAEFVMPIGSLAIEDGADSIEEMMIDRRQYDVSVEAYMIRVAKAYHEPIGVFCASIRGDAYRVNYFVPSPVAPSPRIEGAEIPRASVAYQCTAIGYTAKAREDWIVDAPVQVEYVGIAPYPSMPHPRLMGLVRFTHAEEGRTPIHHLHGNVLEPRGAGLKVVCQLVNNVAKRWGGGIARQAAKRFPAAQREFATWIADINYGERLGKVHFSTEVSRTVIASIVGQRGFGKSKEPRVEYRAIQAGLKQVAAFALSKSASVHLPRIGTGAAGGNWKTIEAMIEEQFVESGLAVNVYTPPPPRMQPEQATLF